ncbi:uncharacterized protein TRAVEDRAFT_61359 [Trametes versicolor FP-101664 SS1]|uniref:uncharacterized protein n=1 Tax=Trametes versicolor (strain FP-101664) TaxID=717944 RepID=UPI0004622EED|nr:uncharacterized protein TRAVEDRAFT_61359 [Trametes versicolor FP-101664 SS1]EIW52442.1 hypothetical protein TRAVEDRAFT_61359 [Trametes versicolor FP-101664 SS1]
MDLVPSVDASGNVTSECKEYWAFIIQEIRWTELASSWRYPCTALCTALGPSRGGCTAQFNVRRTPTQQTLRIKETERLTDCPPKEAASSCTGVVPDASRQHSTRSFATHDTGTGMVATAAQLVAGGAQYGGMEDGARVRP